MFLVLLSILLTTNDYQLNKIIKVDRVEVNHYDTGDNGERASQVILWRWSKRYKRFEVAEWGRLQDADSWYKKQDKTFHWIDNCGNRIKVKAKVIRVTHGLDTEVRDRSLLSPNERRPYLPPMPF